MRLMTRNFKPTFDVLKAFKELSIDDLTFRFDTNGFRVKEVNRGMQTYLDVYFKASGFDEFSAIALNRVSVDMTVNLNDFLDFTFNKNDRITIETQENKMLLKAESDTITKLEIPLLEKSAEDLETIKIDMIKSDTSMIELDFKAFKTILKNYLKEDSVTFEINDNISTNTQGFKINTERGQETKVLKGTDIIKEIRGNAKARYSIEYLKLLTKLDTKTFTNIRIEFKTDFPIVFTLVNENIKVEYLVAPRVCDDE